ncbi:MAG: hypothetical protein BWX88_00499 [Planctomycetes bacterium ADurb.Bin126]|nr:MAG: hypothetical protein BWX88_00499 [Planctomycetes bacterium ADurb.Bin126]HOD82356.1 hypothetical protein [Phycisphaerae bacterium]HQL73629.1 hypothetical protein [Phycisphaerae bacterium]
MSTINLLPTDYLANRARRRANALCLGMFLVVMSGVLGAALVSEQSARRTREVRDRIDASYADAAKNIAEMYQLDQQKKNMLRKAELTGSLVERVPRSTVLGVITNALPVDASLTKITMGTKRIVSLVNSSPVKGGKPATKFQAAAQQAAQVTATTVEMEIAGLARTDVDVARFIAALHRCRLMTSVDLVYSQEKMIQKVLMREFRVKLELLQNTDAIDVVKEMEQEFQEKNKQDAPAAEAPSGEQA